MVAARTAPGVSERRRGGQAQRDCEQHRSELALHGITPLPPWGSVCSIRVVGVSPFWGILAVVLRPCWHPSGKVGVAFDLASRRRLCR